MRFISMSILSLALSITASATTVSQIKANGMIAALSSAPIQQLLQQEDGIGNIQSITSVPSVTEASLYEIQFISFSMGVQVCTVRATVLGANVSVGQARCEEKRSLLPATTVTCQHPSPIGCQD